jgi:prepilin-type processing-associated H-X9-DG protein
MLCSSNLRQIGIALHNYHGDYNRFPTGQVAGTSFSAHSQLLPYLEQDHVSKLINFNLSCEDPANDPPRLTKVKMFRCPSDVQESPIPARGGATNYMANKGSGVVWTGTTGPNAGMPPANGVFFFESRLKVADVIDGTSNTAFFSERVLADGSNGIVSPLEDVFFGRTAPNTPDQALQDCRALDITNLANQFPLFMGAPWIHGQHTYQHISPPNDRSCGFFLVLRATMPPSSRHPSGVNVLMGDGAMRYVTNSIDLNIWRALGTRNGNEVVTDF